VEVVANAHENASQYGHEGMSGYVKELLTPSNMRVFSRLCLDTDDSFVAFKEIELYNEYEKNVMRGETEFVVVSVGIAPGGLGRDEGAAHFEEGHKAEVARVYYLLRHQMAAYTAYLQSRSSEENAYYDEFLVSSMFLRASFIQQCV
jgi:hypothetical protein